ncbi:MAG: DUF2066 domain-containing protein [Kangiellaceae bacterium]|nr:DUF2066 domain-containing protein [Kangiellaceae bacterium]
MARLVKFVSLFILVSSSFFNAVQAEKVNNLYSATWPVDDQSTAQRQRAVANAFAEVLVRVSGKEGVTQSSSIRSAIGNANDYMRQYTYRKLGLAEQIVYDKPLLLVATFDSKAVLRVLRDAGQPIWSEDRPSGVFWVAVEEGGERRVAAERDDTVGVALKRAAARRGLPIKVPVMDMDDQTSIEVSDVWERSVGSLERASRRYTSDFVVAGQLLQDSGQWKGRWTVDMGGDNQTFTTSGATQQQAVSAMMDKIADQLSSKLAVVLSSQAQTLYIMVENIHSIDSYAKARNHLANLSMVKAVNAVQVRGDKVLFAVDALSNAQNLISAIEIGNNLRLSSSDSMSAGGDYTVFRWVD